MGAKIYILNQYERNGNMLGMLLNYIYVITIFTNAYGTVISTLNI